jgi:hypothetical protein
LRDPYRLSWQQWVEAISSDYRTPCDHHVTDDRCYLIGTYTNADTGGYKTQPSWGNDDFWIIKFCEPDIATLVITEQVESTISLFPNPAITQLTIQSPSIPNNIPTMISVVNILGEIVQRHKIVWTNSVTIPVENLPSGIYLVQAVSEEGKMMGKFVRE